MRRSHSWYWAQRVLSPAPLLLLIAAAFWVALDSEAGRGLIADTIERASAGRVRITGLSGALPFAPRVETLVLADADGPWLEAERARLTLQPGALLRGTLGIHAVDADSIELGRLPAGRDRGASRSWLPFRIEVDQLSIGRLRLNGLVAEAPALGVKGSGSVGADGRLETALRITPLDDARLDGHIDLRLEAQIGQALPSEAARGVPETASPPRQTSLSAHITAAIHEAPPLIAGLLGAEPALSFTAEQGATGWAIERATLQAAALSAVLSGTVTNDQLNLGWQLAIEDLGLLTEQAHGRLQAQGQLSGRATDPIVEALLAAEAGTETVGTGQVSGTLMLRPVTQEAALALDGDWARQPVAVQMVLRRLDTGALNLRLGDSHWAGIRVGGSLLLQPGETLPLGELHLAIDRVEVLDALLAPWLGDDPALAGRLEAGFSRRDRGALNLDLEGAALQLPDGIGIRSLNVRAEIHEPLGASRLRSEAIVAGLSTAAFAADIRLQASGPIETPTLSSKTDLQWRRPGGETPVQLVAGGILDARVRRLQLDALRLDLPGQGVRLLGPARLELGHGLEIDGLRLALRAPDPDGNPVESGRLELDGRLAPLLELEARITALPVAVAMGWLPAPLPRLTGRIDLETRLTGEPRGPFGTLSMDVRGLRYPGGLARSLPAGELRLALRLEPPMTTIDARASVGTTSRLALDGRIGAPPFDGSADLALDAQGQLDLGLLEPLLSQAGRQAAGRLALDLGIGGSLDAPRVDGRVRLREGAWRDRLLGLILTDITGALRLAGDELLIERLSARADPGTLTLSGHLGWLQPSQPVDLRLSARNASPLQLDRLQLQGDADLRLQGNLPEGRALSGSARFERIDLRIPERFPVTIATLEVEEVGERRQPPRRARRSGPANTVARSGSVGAIALDLALSAPQAITVRGRGVDALLGGDISVQGTLGDPSLLGGFNLLRGDYELAGQQLGLTRGRIGFDGASILDPSLDLEARVQAAGATAILAIEGTARTPIVRLRGEPEMPEDEVLARLLFGRSRSRLSAVQITRIGLAAASLAGIGGGGPGLLERARSGLGLNRLRIDGDTDGRDELVVQGGRYLSERIYLGARQGTRTGETWGLLRMELSPQLRLETDLGGSGGARAGAAFELEY
ncbi:translocation/assembly module TamB domain-containing protein [Halochromatium glycolicum]|uniref:Translocation and assembly module TamB C-terminal domain-containing protein n=1 Tax=Halochromatium glycolicum TaxID=85075 RepID=A0AAJ0U3T1_9GAMM|nr:translocation/assembly module TamB domain-containing protein [Halochromatium glycolicum]MBK1704320.1 hypothetical protein [Halochromatium glycolicum]